MPFSDFNPQSYYASQGQISDPGGYTALFEHLPEDIAALTTLIQGLMLHIYWADQAGITLNRVRRAETNLRTMKKRSEKIQQLSQTPLTTPRALSKKTIGTCRDFALFLASLLRHQAIPARARAGFGTYFTKGRFEDHWICEYWHKQAGRWVGVDAQLDPTQIETLKIDFDPLDVPKTRFVDGGRAWRMCRAGEADPHQFGIFRMKGLDFVKGNLIRDFLSLNKIEILPWDNFQLIEKPFRKMIRAEKDLMDKLGRMTTGDDRDFLLVRSAFTANQQHLLPRYFFNQ